MNENKIYSESKILITGSRGYIGNELLQFFRRKGLDVRGSVGDLSRREVWEENIDGEFDFIFHLAATEGKNSNVEMNSLSTLNMLNTCVANNIKPRIIFASSTNLYGATDIGVVDEESSSFPLSEYSAHKLLAEGYLRLFNKKYGIPSLTLRIPNVYGPSSSIVNFEKSVINRVLKTALKEKKITLFNNRDCLRDFIYIDDIVNAFYASGKLSGTCFNGDFYNLGSSAKFTLVDAWEILQEKTDVKIITIDNKCVLAPMEYRSFDCDSAKFRRASEWTDMISFNKGVDLTIDYLKNL